MCINYNKTTVKTETTMFTEAMIAVMVPALTVSVVLNKEDNKGKVTLIVYAQSPKRQTSFWFEVCSFVKASA